MNYCKIENGAVTNVATFDAAMPPGWGGSDTWIQSDVAGPGWTYANGVFTAPPIPSPPAPSAEELRLAAYRADPTRQNLIALIQGATPAQVNTWLVNNVTTLAQARAVLGQLILLVGGNSLS